MFDKTYYSYNVRVIIYYLATVFLARPVEILEHSFISSFRGCLLDVLGCISLVLYFISYCKIGSKKKVPNKLQNNY